MAFFKKELLGIFKTYKIWVVPVIFLFFGLMSPPVAKLAPQIVESALPKGMSIEIPEPTILDSFGQYFKNLAQLGILAVILLSMGLVSEEKSKGTLQLIVTKPVSRGAVVLSKFVAQTLLIISSMAVSGVVCYLYSIVIFKEGGFLEFSQANLLFIVYYVLIISITIFFSTVLSNQIAAGGLSIIVLAVLSVTPVLNKSFEQYSPAALTGIANKIMLDQAKISQAGWPVVISLVFILFLLFVGIFIFSRQEL